MTLTEKTGHPAQSSLLAPELASLLFHRYGKTFLTGFR